MEKPKILGIVGPTASGKTALGFALAEVRPIEIVCMDSMQVYKGMDIGTAKPSKEERALIPHHMLDVAEPEDEYSVAEYLQGASAAIEGILSRSRLPVLIGGTGLYLRALSQGLTLGGTPKNEAVRARYEALLAEEGQGCLHRKLQEVDPGAAARLHPNDTRRVIRALEVYEVTGRPFSGQKPREEDAPFDIRLFAPDWPRDELYARVDQRAHGMLRGGLLDEVRALLDYCGVEFEAACLAFHQTERAIRTPSSEQVRQPIFRDGTEAWKPFAEYLEPLRAALGEVLECYPQAPAAW